MYRLFLHRRETFKMTKNTIAVLLSCGIAFGMCACIPDSVKEKMDEGVAQAHNLLAEQEFKKAIGEIELHKLRNGSYPNALAELKFLSPMDSATINSFVEYAPLDSGYELNVKMDLPRLSDQAPQVTLKLPAEFWQGLGCVRSNLKD
jgi:hypothetical protein